jgi:hypothetical protein
MAVAGLAIGAPIPGILMPCIAIPARSIITLDMKHSFRRGRIIRRPARGEKVLGHRPQVP